MSSSIYSIRQGVTVAALCLISEFSYGLVSCQNGLDYKNSCNPYDITFKKVTKNLEVSNHYVVNESNLNKKIYHSKSYLDMLLERYENDYNENSGLLSLIDRSSYSALKLKEINESNIKIKPKPKSKPKPTEVAKSEKIEKTQQKSIKLENENFASKSTKNQKTPKKLTIAENRNNKKLDKTSTKITKVSTLKSSKLVKDSSRLYKKDIKITQNNNQLEKYKLYTVQKGDSLIKIAKKFSIKKSLLISLNSLDKNKTIKIGQKIKLPLYAKVLKDDKKQTNKKQNIQKVTKYKNIYIVKKGDTLSSIAKKTNTSITLLREINRLSRSSHIRVGQIIKLKPTTLTKREIRSFNFTRDIKFKKVPSIKFKRRIRVTATAYTSHRSQTDKTPFLAAWNNRIRPGMKVIAVSPDLIKKYGLTNGVKVKIMGLSGYYVVRDKMNKKWKNRIDIYMGTNKRRAMKWGRRKIVLYW